jgi:two-component system sensor histidine kinase KdpD
MVRLARLNVPARLQDAEARAQHEATEHREARVVRDLACALLSARGSCTEQPELARVQSVLTSAGLRLDLAHAPCPGAGETALPVRLRKGSGWLYAKRDGEWSRDDAERIAARLAELLDQGEERARRSATQAEADAGRHAEVAKSAILHAISNDLESPLTAVKTAAGALTEPELGEEERIRLGRVVAAEAEELARIVADLADLSRIGAGAVNPKPESCDIAATIERSADRVRMHRGDYAINFNLPPNLPHVNADPAQLERVFVNLIDNAVKFSPPGGAIEIRGVAANGRVTVRVVDRGRGIAPGRQAQVFEPFVRHGDAHPGSGLGLAICRGFVEANGGRIALQSQARDGSAFAVTFPVGQQPSAVH